MATTGMFKFTYVQSGKATYDAILAKEANTMYAIPDTKEIYFEDQLVASQNVEISAALPSTGRAGAIYVATTTNPGIYYYDATVPAGEENPVGWKSIVSYADFITAAGVQTLTNKTIDADNNSISNLEVDNFKSGVVVDASTGIGPATGEGAATDTQLPTAAAVRAAVDAAVSTVKTDLDWKESVASYDAIATTYPTPEEGWTVSVADTNQVYRYDAATSTWVNIFTTDSNVVEASTNGVGGHNGLMTAAQAEKLAGVATGAEVNQNAFSIISDGTNNVEADAKTDTVTFEGATGGHITVTADAANDKVSFGLADSGVTAGTYAKVTVDAKGIVTSGVATITSQDVVAMTGYTAYATAPVSTAIAATDTLNEAVAKLEYRLDNLIKTSMDAEAQASDAYVLSTKAIYNLLAVERI